MLGRDSADRILAATAYDQSGDKIGSVGRLYMNDQTGEPAWVSVKTGLFGTKESFVPMEGASLDGDRLSVTVTQDAVKHAPQVDLDDEHLGQTESQQLYSYYGLDQPATDGPGEPGPLPDQLGRGAEPPMAAEGNDPAPTGSDSGVQETGQPGLRLRRHRIVEEQTITVPVVREEYVLEDEPERDDTPPRT